MMNGKRKLIFGGEAGWNVEDWTASDDRVRGGKSKSYLSCSKSTARFYGNLDVKTLGGAGFASQRTTGEDREWDLTDYEGIELLITEADAKQYTFILKDELLPPDPATGREQSTISYEYDFKVAPLQGEETNASVRIAWDDFKATYRGKEKKDGPSLDIQKIKRMSLMMRSFFGTQEGDFALTIGSISAIAQDKSTPTITHSDSSSNGKTDSASLRLAENKSESVERANRNQDKANQGFISWLVKRWWKL